MSTAAGGLPEQEALRKTIVTIGVTSLDAAPSSGIAIATVTGELGKPGAEGATAPETLRQMDRCVTEKLWRVVPHAPAEGITISGERTEGAFCWAHFCGLLSASLVDGLLDLKRRGL